MELDRTVRGTRVRQRSDVPVDERAGVGHATVGIEVNRQWGFSGSHAWDSSSERDSLAFTANVRDRDDSDAELVEARFLRRLIELRIVVQDDDDLKGVPALIPRQIAQEGDDVIGVALGIQG